MERIANMNANSRTPTVDDLLSTISVYKEKEELRVDVATLNKIMSDLEQQNAQTLSEYKAKLVDIACAEREASRRNCSLAALDVDALTCERRAPRSPVGVSRYQFIHTQRLFLSPFLPLTSVLIAWGMTGLSGGKFTIFR